jgi:glycosyltransferase involved in cell wall biosynthesis/tetratricopeptide (TPR) repeat protein
VRKNKTGWKAWQMTLIDLKRKEQQPEPDSPPPKDLPTVALMMIVRDGGERLLNCLESAARHFDEIVVALDTRTTDNSRSIIEDAGGEVFDFEWCDDFSAARNFILDKVTAEWAIWIDADDVLEGGDLIKEAVASLPEAVGGIWCPYYYAFDDFGNCTTLFERERIVRMSVGWHWQARLHETMAIKSGRPLPWARNSDIRIIHTRGYESRSERNFHYLNLMFDEAPDVPRTWQYFGFQYFHMGEWEKAIEWFAKFYNDPRVLEWDAWQARLYTSKAYRMMEDYGKAIGVARRCRDEKPGYMDGYLELGESYARLEMWEECIIAMEHSLDKEMPPSFMILNPLEYTFTPPRVLGVAYAAVGDMEKAIEWTEKALEIRPGDESLTANLDYWGKEQEAQQQAQSFLMLTKEMDDDDILKLAALTNGVGEYRSVKEVVVPAQMRVATRGTQPLVVFMCGNAIRPWSPLTPESQGIGGSETAVIEIAKRLQKDGAKVLVFNDPGEEEGWYDGVGYLNFARMNSTMPCDVLVSWRRPEVALESTGAKTNWLWMHDLNKEAAFLPAHAEAYDKVFGVSEWHRDYLKMVYPFLGDKADYLHNGINLDRFPDLGFKHKQRFKVVYTSSPDRGLANLLGVWPYIVNQEPAAELHIFYGWDNFDALIAKGSWGAKRMKDAIMGRMEGQKGIFWRGNLPQSQLAQELSTAQVWAYPTTFTEVFCISAVEAMAAGLIPITSILGALPEVLGDVGIQIPGNAGSFAYLEAFKYGCMVALTDFVFRRKAQYRAFNRAPLWTWDTAYEKWSKELAAAVRIPVEV